MCVGLPQVTEQDKNETGGDGCRAVLCEREEVTLHPWEWLAKCHHMLLEYGVMVNITAFHAVARGSIPRTRSFLSFRRNY